MNVATSPRAAHRSAGNKPRAAAMTTPRRDRLAVFAVVIGASVVAAVSARPWVGSWNDGSRLATVESLVDRHTFAIDDSIFSRPSDTPPEASTDAHPAPRLVTQDKLLIGGRYYSDKPPVPALLMAGFYQLWRWGGGTTARERPDRFCYWSTLASSGLAYVVAVACVFLIGQSLLMSLAGRLALTASFAFATLALPYARHVNAHVVLLGIAAALFLQLVRQGRGAPTLTRRLVGLGTLAGLGYSVDLAAGPLLLVATLALVAYRCRRPGALVVCALAALPWVGLHHALNYAIGGTIAPANTVPEYLLWPGSPFTRATMTGVWPHDGVRHFLGYALALLFGPRGFLDHNLPLWLALIGAVMLTRQRPGEMPEVVGGAAWCIATWLAYGLASTNYSGECASIRWFVPLLVPGYLVLAVVLRERPDLWPYLLILSGWGTVLAARMWWNGPWVRSLGGLFWPVQLAALASCVAWYAFRRRRLGDRGAPQSSRDGRAPARLASPG